MNSDPKTNNCFVGVSLCTVLVIGLSLTVACGGGSTSTLPPAPAVVISVSPPGGIWIAQGATEAFTATVTGTTNTAVTWQVKEGAAGGSITSLGVYTAPNKAGTFHVIASSQADTSKSATAEVTVPSVSVSINQSQVTIDIGEQFPFSASVGGTVNQAVTWSVQEGLTGGNITTGGVYTAPQAHGTYHVIATGLADTTQTATAIVNVTPVSVSISPSSDVLGPAGGRTFGATVTTSLNSNVTWSVEEGSGGGAITTGGQYTAPANTGSFHVVATSMQDPTKNAMAELTIVPSGFQPTGNMKVARDGPAAVLLQTGKVLIAGGYHIAQCRYHCTSGPLSSAELYDSGSGTFAATGSMSVARTFPTATLLATGKVLVAGGGDASAELYDPTTGKFTPTGHMTVVRSSYTATLVPNGKVLLTGGYDANMKTLASAELYDPDTGTFIATGSMSAARSSHTATLLANGKILIAGGGGFGATDVLATAEIYDPEAGSFSSTGGMTVQRTSHTATLLGTGQVLIAGGQSSNSELASAEIYDAMTGSFSATTNMMMIPRENHMATLLPNGSVLVVGGISGSVSYTAELYDPGPGVFTQTGSMESAREFAAAVLLPDGRVLVSGGMGGLIRSSPTLNSAEVYK